MNAQTIPAMLRPNFHLRWCKALLYITIVPLVVWHLVGATLRVIRFVRSVTSSGELITQLDSFSQPSIAAGVLKREMDTLISQYSDRRNEALELELARSPEHLVSKSQPLTRPPKLSSQSAVLVSPPMRDLQTLRSTLHQLNVDLNWELMNIYYSNESWNEFLDCYLCLVNEAPAMANAVWTRAALEAAQCCGRTVEIVDALQYFRRYHPNVTSAHVFTIVLQEWQTNPQAALPQANQ